MEVITLFFVVVIVVAAVIIAYVIYNKSRGSVKVVLDGYQFQRGGKVTGKLVVNLKKTIHAQKLTVALMETRQNRTAPVSVGNQFPQGQDVRQTLFQFEMPLDGEKDYLQQEYPFAVDIPAAQPGASGIIGGIIQTVESFSSVTRWTVTGHLYISGKPDIRGHAQINVN